MNQAAADGQAPPLDEVMLAMDVVDTLRRRRRLVQRELDEEGRELDLKERLRRIYAAQGIEVPDHVLAEGVAALKEDRFVYTPPADGVATKLARLYVSREGWGKWLLGGLAGVLLAWLAHYFLVVAPRAELPLQLQATHAAIIELAATDRGRQQADERLAAAQAALSQDKRDQAEQELARLEQLRNLLNQTYTLQVVAGPGERSGVWRIPDANTRARNYYIIVEPVGGGIEVPIRNEETGRVETVAKWGLRVEKSVYDRIAADKQDDGIIQNRVFGNKQRGHLQPEYRFPTTGAAITKW